MFKSVSTSKVSPLGGEPVPIFRDLEGAFFSEEVAAITTQNAEEIFTM